MKYLEPVTDAYSAKAFLAALNAAHMLYHPEESAEASLRLHDLAPDVLHRISANMSATWDHLNDPCAMAVNVMRNAERLEIIAANPSQALDLLEIAESYLERWAAGTSTGSALRQNITDYLNPQEPTL